MMRCVAALLTALMLLTPATHAANDVFEENEEPAEVVEVEQDWRLLLVNPWNKLPEDLEPELESLPNGLQVDARIFDDLTAMLTDCQKAGLRPVVCSAYRTKQTQTRLHNNKIARLQAAGYSKEAAVREAGRWVAVPGTSEHQTGLAVDLVSASYQVLNRKQEQTKEQKWLMEHCWEYGFILRFPSDKSDVTGIGYEPWHYRYVGKETALAMRDSGLCLEEYLTALESTQKNVQDVHTQENQAVDKPGNVGKRKGRVCGAGPQDVSEGNRA